MFAGLLNSSRGIDQANMGIGLRKIPERRAGCGIDFLGEQAQVVGMREHLLELTHRTPGKLIFIDSRRHIGRFRCGILKPNRAECLRAVQDAGVTT